MDAIDWLMLAGVVMLLIAAGWLFIKAGVTYEPPEEPVLGVDGIDRAPSPYWHNHSS